MLHVVQHVGTQTRVVSFTYSGLGSSYPQTISCEGRTWQYVWSAVYPFNLTEVIPPEGPSWHLSFASSTAEEWHNAQIYRSLTTEVRVTLPAGGWVQYDTVGYTDCGMLTLCNPYNPADCFTQVRGCDWQELPKLRTRTTGGRGIPSGAWSFTYDNGTWSSGPYASESGFITTITGPGTYARHLHKTPLWTGITANPVREITVGSGPGEANVVDRTTFAWRYVRDWPMNPPFDFPRGYQDLVPSAIETMRAGRTYRRTFTYADDTEAGHLAHFGQPVQIVETGDFTRTTDLSYHAFTGARWLRDGVAQVTVDGIVTSSAEYDNNTGFATSRTALGVTTTFVPDDWGNVASQKDANNYWTSFNYTWGAVSAVHTPLYTTSFGINEYGETTWATQRGFTTEFTYDGLGRQTRVHPPIGNDTVTTYAPDASWVKVARGASWTHTDLDGFGRAVGTVNSVATNTLTTYNALGQVTYASAPYSGVQHTGTQFEYRCAGARPHAHESGRLGRPLRL